MSTTTTKTTGAMGSVTPSSMWLCTTVAAVACFALLRLTACSGGSSGGGAAPLDGAGSLDATPFDAGAGASSDGAVEDTDPLDGWAPYTDYGAACPFYVPAQGTQIPALQWDPCPPSLANTIAACSLIRIPNGQLLSVAYGEAQQQSVTLGFYIGTTTFGAFTFIDGDGHVLNALAIVATPDCAPDLRDVHEGRYVLSIHDSRGGPHKGYGVVAGTVGTALPTFAYQFTDGNPHDHKATERLGVVDFYNTATIRLMPWSAPSSELDVWSSARDGLQQASPHSLGDYLFWDSTAGSTVNKIKRYSLDAGAEDFISFAPDPSHGVADLGTDGHDLVWLDGKSPSSSGQYQIGSIMTAPYVTDPTQLQPRRLRSGPTDDFGVVNFVVGCGYAARSTGTGIIVVRLSDGVEWFLKSGPPGWNWLEPIALSCDELFANVSWNNNAGLQVDVARVKLSMLTPALPAD